VRWKPVLAGVVAFAVLMNGHHLSAEAMIARLVDRFLQNTGVCDEVAAGPRGLGSVNPISHDIGGRRSAPAPFRGLAQAPE
jgi:hypothetical protein